MQAAFIDIGLERTAFLHVSDIAQPEIDGDTAAALPRTENIRDLVNEGDDLPVQVLKDPLGTKGARLTTFITLPSRYLVYMPKGHGTGVSSRIEDEAERNRLREVARKLGTPSHMVDSADELLPEWFEGRQRVGLTAGASAPEVLVQQVAGRLKALGVVSVRKLAGIEETVKFPLPKGLRL